jgi:hypothetical protein
VKPSGRRRIPGTIPECPRLKSLEQDKTNVFLLDFSAFQSLAHGGEVFVPSARSRFRGTPDLLGEIRGSKRESSAGAPRRRTFMKPVRRIPGRDGLREGALEEKRRRGEEKALDGSSFEERVNSRRVAR